MPAAKRPIPRAPAPTAPGANRRGMPPAIRDKVVCSVGGRRAGGRWGECSREAGGDERCIARHRQQRLGTKRRCPIEPGEHAGKRALATERSVRKNRRGEGGKPRRIAIGTDRDDVSVRSERRGDARQHRQAADFQQRLVLPVHSPRATAGEDQCSNFVRYHARHVATVNGLSGAKPKGRHAHWPRLALTRRSQQRVAGASCPLEEAAISIVVRNGWRSLPAFASLRRRMK